jgi:hypothetical protein
MKTRALLPMYLIVTMIGVAVTTVAGCKTAVLAPPQPGKSTSQLTEFRRLKPGASEPVPGFRLDAVERLTERLSQGPIEYKATNDYYKWQTDYPSPHLNVTFPSLSESQFNELKRTYGFGLSRVKYKRGEAYSLGDFLMPFMQATLNHEFESEVQEDYTRIASNCWGTAYEVVRTSIGQVGNGKGSVDASLGAVLFYADTGEMQAILQDDKRSQRLGRGVSIDEIYEQARISTTPIDFGDVFLVLDQSGVLEHALTFIDRDVWFEKVGYGAGSPYRLTTTKDFFHKLNDGRMVEWRRFPRGGLPDPVDEFKTIRYLEPAPGGTTRILDTPVAGPLTRRDVNFEFDAMGRATLEASAYRPVARRGNE